MLLPRRALVGHLISTLLAPPDRRSDTALSSSCDAETPPLSVTSAQLAADEDRSRAELVLRENFAHGRLTLDELTTRVASLHAARTVGQLRATLTDLPGDPWAVATASPAGEDQARTALLLALISVLVPVPPLVLGMTAAGLGARSLRAGTEVRRGRALAAVTIGSATTFAQALALILWLARVI